MHYFSRTKLCNLKQYTLLLYYPWFVSSLRAEVCYDVVTDLRWLRVTYTKPSSSKAPTISLSKLNTILELG